MRAQEAEGAGTAAAQKADDNQQATQPVASNLGLWRQASIRLKDTTHRIAITRFGLSSADRLREGTDPSICKIAAAARSAACPSVDA